MKKLLSVLVMAGLLAGLGCGSDTSTTKEKGGKEKGTTTGKDKEKPPTPDTRKDL